MSSCTSALEKSCVHEMASSFRDQCDRLTAAGYPQHLVSAVCVRLLQKQKTGSNEQRRKEKMRVHVIPYHHGLSHNLKKVAARYGLSVVFSAPCKLSKVCPMMKPRVNINKCKKEHSTRYTECASGVIYEIPLSCGRVYIGETGRCFNLRAREHFLSIKNNTGGHLSVHCLKCGCHPDLQRTRVLARANEATERKLVEAYFIKKKGHDCISMQSVSLSDKEFSFLDGHV